MQRRPKRIHADAASAGFSAVEIMVVLAVLAILSGMGAISFASVSGKTRVATDAGSLLNAIELTRSEAAKRGRRVTLLPTRGDWAAGWTVFVDLDGNRQVDPDEPVIMVQQPLKATTRIVANTTPGYIAFAGSGMPQLYNGGFLAATVTLCDTGNGRSVVLAKTGRPRVATIAC